MQSSFTSTCPPTNCNRPAGDWPAAPARGIYTGIRLGVNDVRSTEIMLGMVNEMKSRALLVRADLSRRLGDRWSLELRYYGFRNAEGSPALGDYSGDGHLTVSLRRYL